MTVQKVSDYLESTVFPVNFISAYMYIEISFESFRHIDRALFYRFVNISCSTVPYLISWKLKLYFVIFINELRHDKTNKISVPPLKTQISLGIRPVWSESSLCAQSIAKDPMFLHVDSEDSDQIGWMPRLIWVFAGHTLILLFCHVAAQM